jgi:hypothetical protein
MNKIKIFAFIALAVIFSACGSDDGSAPELANDHSGTISPFDTLVVKFKSDLADIDKLDTSNIIINNGKLVTGKTTGKELRFIGTNLTPGGSYHFNYAISDSIVFKNLKNVDGYTKERTVLYFSTYPISDHEPNNTEEDANDVELLGNILTGITFAGVIDKGIGINDQGFTSYDTDDFYKFNLKQGDIISITASNKTTPFKIHFYGTCNSGNKTECNDKTDSTSTAKKSITLIDTVKTGHLLANDPVGKMLPFYLNVIDKNISEKSNPYNLTIKVTFRKP